MMSTQEKNAESKHLPLMVYMPQETIDVVKNFAIKNNMSVSQAVRNGIKHYIALTEENGYISGYKEGVETCAQIANEFIDDVDKLLTDYENDIKTHQIILNEKQRWQKTST